MHLYLKSAAPAGVALALLAGTSLLAKPAQAQLTIVANITDPQNAPQAGLNDTIQRDFNAFATDFDLTKPLTLTATITWDNEGPEGLGASNNDSGSLQNVGGILYANALDQYVNNAPATITAGAPNGTDFDITLNDVDTLWSADLGTPSDPTSYSLANVLYHETMHSMGFTADNNSDGSYAFDAPTKWDTLLYDGTTQQSFIDDNQQQRAAVMISGDADGNNGELFFDGADAEAANGGKMVSMFAPSTFQDGSSDGSHIAPNQAGAGLLYPSLDPGNYFVPSPLELAMMADDGWTTKYNLTPTNGLTVTPEPSQYAGLGLGALGLLGLGFKARRRKATADA